jgi:integrase
MEKFEKEFVRRYPNYEFLVRYMRAAVEKEEVNWCDLTATNLTDFVNYLKDSVSPNSAGTYCAVLKSFLNLASDEVDLPTMRFAKILCVRKVPQQNVALTEEEVRRIDEYYQRLLKKDKHKVEKDVLTLFLIECYCGSRGIDVENMTVDNISDGKITYVSQKTHVLAIVPEHHRIRDLFLRKPKKNYSRVTKNRIIKDVCEKCGIDELVTLYYHGSMVTKKKYELCAFHSARRSFASILAAKGVPIPEISQYMSHSSLSMTERYIKVDSKKVSEEALSFFNR